MSTFNNLNLDIKLVQGLEKESITVPTKIQEDAIPIILENKDLIGEAVTGSGKTLAYLLPAFERIDSESREIHTLILSPSHELAIQIHNVIKTLITNSGKPLRSGLIIGNVNINRQIETLKSKPQIIVGTPGRILELIAIKKFKAHFIKTIVIDEADKLLSDSNIKAVKDVIKTTQKERQILAFSASISPQTKERATELMKEPISISLNDEEKINNDIEHIYVISTWKERLATLRKVIHATKSTKTIVFINKNELIQELVDRLNFHKISAVGIFGNATKAARKEAIDAFKGGKATVLVSSDLLARGLDFPDVEFIISYDIPPTMTEYTHRVGRTGRAGTKGTAISIVTSEEKTFIEKLERHNSITIQQKELSVGKLISPKKQR